MRKIVGESGGPNPPEAAEGWLDLETIAQVEMTSEDPAHPIELAFRPGGQSGWRAASKGQQTIRLYFDEPVALRRIHLEFVEPRLQRAQEFTLSWAPDRAGPYHLIVRQQWNFNPDNATTEVEDFRVDLHEVRALELVIRPDLSQGQGLASIARWSVG
ncbi:MAG: carbohydrate-binding protein [Verrucomicrobia bacterium]|nr:carbohydrate-binding protein [Verrucomicrobiota bacterium]